MKYSIKICACLSRLVLKDTNLFLINSICFLFYFGAVRCRICIKFVFESLVQISLSSDQGHRLQQFGNNWKRPIKGHKSFVFPDVADVTVRCCCCCCCDVWLDDLQSSWRDTVHFEVLYTCTSTLLIFIFWCSRFSQRLVVLISGCLSRGKMIMNFTHCGANGNNIHHWNPRGRKMATSDL